MASNGEGKGRVASAEAEGGYGYGGYDGWHWQHFKWWPCLVPTIIIACVAVFAVEMNENNCPMHESRYGGCVAGFMRRFSFQPLRENPLLGPSSATLERMGALDWNKIVHQHQVWRLISSMWLHAGLIHLIVNMLSLTFIGMRLEQQIGLVHFGAIYIVSGFGGSVLSTLFLQNNYISVGASGALFGLLGSMLSELIMNWTIYTNKTAAISTLLFVIALNLAIGIFPHVDNFSHIGGFATGFLLGFVLLARPQFGWMERHELPQTSQPPKYKAYQYVLWVVALILLLVGFVISLVMLSMGKNGYDSCHWSHYLNCVPTSSWKCKT